MEHQATKSQGVKDQRVSFQSLSSGIGLGALKPPSDHPQQGKGGSAKSHKDSTAELPRGKTTQGARSQALIASGRGPVLAAEPVPGLSLATTSLPQMGPQVAVMQAGNRRLPPGAASFRLVIERMMLASGIDLLFVAISVFVVTFGSMLVNYFRAERGTPLTELMPLDWILAQEAARLMAGFFAVYLVYVVAFLVCAGGTLGSIMVRTPFNHRK